MSGSHKKGTSKDSFGKAAAQAVDAYEKWCKDHGKQPDPEVEVELRVKIDPGSSLSEYIAILRIDE